MTRLSEAEYLAAWRAQLKARPPEKIEPLVSPMVELRDMYPDTGTCEDDYERHRGLVRLRRVCEQCGRGFDIKRAVADVQTHYCSTACKKVAQYQPPARCENCGNPVKAKGHVYCSKACRAEGMGAKSAARIRTTRRIRQSPPACSRPRKPRVPADLTKELSEFASANRGRGQWCRCTSELKRLVTAYGVRNTAAAYGVTVGQVSGKMSVWR